MVCWSWKRLWRSLFPENFKLLFSYSIPSFKENLTGSWGSGWGMGGEGRCVICKTEQGCHGWHVMHVFVCGIWGQQSSCFLPINHSLIEFSILFLINKSQLYIHLCGMVWCFDTYIQCRMIKPSWLTYPLPKLSIIFLVRHLKSILGYFVQTYIIIKYSCAMDLKTYLPLYLPIYLKLAIF